MQEIGKFTISIDEHGILSLRIREPGTRLNRDDAELAWPAIEALVAGRKLPVLFDSRHVVSADWENQSFVRDRLATFATHGAIVTNSNIEIVLGTIFMKVWHPPFPMQIFGSEEKAMDWLLSRM